MEDKGIIALFFKRSEQAIAETDAKYGNYCRAVANRILHSEQDSEECVDDTYMRAWSAIPPTVPKRLATYLGRITRNLALDRFAKSRAEKRFAPVLMILDELDEIIPDPQSEAGIDESITLRDALSDFLKGLRQSERRIFVQRYWYMCSVKEIAEDNRLTESNVKVTLMRIRGRLRAHLESLGIFVDG